MSTATLSVTEKQISFINSLIDKVGLVEELDGVEDLSTLSRSHASDIISALIKARDEQKAAEYVEIHEAGSPEAPHAQIPAEPTFALEDGYYTVVMEGVGHRTFRVKTAKGGNLSGRRIISYLMGSDNESDYQGFGFVSATGVNFWKRFKEDSLLGYAVSVLLGDAEKAQKDYALISENCYRCGKLLTDPTSIELGIGPVCRGDA